MEEEGVRIQLQQHGIDGGNLHVVNISEATRCHGGEDM